MRRPRFIVGLALVMATGLPATIAVGQDARALPPAGLVSQTPPKPKGSINPPLQPVINTPFRLTGEMPATSRRVALLKTVARAGRRTRTLSRSHLDRRGRFVFSSVRLAGPTRVRVVTPKTRTFPWAATPALTINPLDQWVSLAALPGVSQPGVDPQPPPGSTQLLAAFSPLAPGRALALQRREGGRWLTVKRATQDFNGDAVFDVPPGGRYRVRASATPQLAPIISKPVVASAWDERFRDDFNGSDVNGESWRDSPVAASAEGLRTCARSTPALRSVGQGVLSLRVGLDPERLGRTCSYTSEGYPGTSPWMVFSQVDTRQSFSFTHGVAAARIKFQRQRGMHSGFWLLPVQGRTPGRPELGTEIDVVEYFGESSLKGGVGSFLHWLDDSGTNRTYLSDYAFTKTLLPPGDEWWSSYHVFSVEWNPSGYVFRIDGHEFWRRDVAISQAPQYLVLSIIPSDYELDYLDPTTMSNPALVDWVSVWQPGS